jgi:hypothetical protein
VQHVRGNPWGCAGLPARGGYWSRLPGVRGGPSRRLRRHPEDPRAVAATTRGGAADPGTRPPSWPLCAGVIALRNDPNGSLTRLLVSQARERTRLCMLGSSESVTNPAIGGSHEHE